MEEQEQYNNVGNGDGNPAIPDPYALFIYALNSPVTRERYSTRLRYFLTRIGLTSNDPDNKKSIEQLQVGAGLLKIQPCANVVHSPLDK